MTHRQSYGRTPRADPPGDPSGTRTRSAQPALRGSFKFRPPKNFAENLRNLLLPAIGLSDATAVRVSNHGLRPVPTELPTIASWNTALAVAGDHAKGSHGQHDPALTVLNALRDDCLQPGIDEYVDQSERHAQLAHLQRLRSAPVPHSWHTLSAKEVFGAEFLTASTQQTPPRDILLFAVPIPILSSKSPAKLPTASHLSGNMLSIDPLGYGRCPGPVFSIIRFGNSGRSGYRTPSRSIPQRGIDHTERVRCFSLV